MVKRKIRISDFEFRNAAARCVVLLYFAMLFSVAFSDRCLAQDVHATARVDSNRILIGDWLNVYLTVQHPENVSVNWRSLPDSLEGFEILKRDTPSAKKDNQQVLESSTWTLSAFDSGMAVIPPLRFQYTVSGDTTVRSVETSPIPIFVRGIAVDTTQEIKDIKPPLSVSISFLEILPYLIGIVVLGGVVWFVYYFRKKRLRGEPLIPEAPSRPPHEIALDALRSLEAERLWQRGKIKEYYSELTDIVRLYIEKKFRVPALESTTDEIMGFDAINALPNNEMGNLKEVLARADLVKFAKFQPATEEHESSLKLSRDFVESTWHPASDPVHQHVDEVKS